MKIIFNASCIQQPLTGIGHFAHETLQQMQRLIKDDLLAYHFTPPHRKVLPQKNFKFASYKKILMQLPLAYSINRFIKNQKFLKFIKHHPGDLYFEPNFILMRSHLPSVPCIYDLSFIRHPESHPKYRCNIFKKYLEKTLKKAKAIITISEFSKAEMIEIFKIDADKIHVSYCGASAEFRPRTKDETQTILHSLNLLYRQFILVIGTFEPRKNIIRTCQAYALLPEDIRNAYPLILCGASGWGKIHLSEEIQGLIEKQQIRILQYVSNETLHQLSASAKFSCYASIYEGFGLPVLEAMQSGTPIITSNCSSMPEVAGEAAILINPYDVKDIQQAMLKLLQDEALCQQLTLKGIEQAKKFSWEKTAQIIIKACHSI